jgi:hypothetical protein
MAAPAAPVAIDVEVARTPAAADCPTPDEMHAAVEHIVGRRLDGATAPHLRATVEFQRDAAGFAAIVLLSGAKTGERRLTDTGSTCAPLAQAVAVTIAVLVDLGSEPAVAPPTGSPQPAAGTRGEFWLAGAGDVGLVAEATTAFGGGMAVAWERWSLRGSGEAVVPREAHLAPGGVSVGLLRGQVLLCHDLARGRRAELGGCAGGSAGWLYGHGHGYPVSADAGFAWAAGSAALRVGGGFGGRFVWGIEAGLLAPLVRHTFSVENAGVAYRSSALAGVAQLQVGARLW